jgi:hypothetical protein
MCYVFISSIASEMRSFLPFGKQTAPHYTLGSAHC